MTLYGRDVSEHQTTTPPLAGKTFLIPRATIGSRQDGMYHQHIAAGRAKGLVLGAFHFNWSTWDVNAQCDAFISVAGDVDLYALDVEPDHSHGVTTPPFSRGQAMAFINRFQRLTGKPIGLYHSLSGYFDAGQDWNWIAAWVPTRPARADIWQYQGSPADLDRFEGTRVELLELGIPKAPPSDTGDTVNQYDVIDDTLVDVPAGVYLHYDSAMQPDARNVKSPAGGLKGLALVGNAGDGTFRIVEYQGVAWWVYWTGITNMRIKPVPPIDCTQQVHTAVELEYDRVVGGSKIAFPPRT